MFPSRLSACTWLAGLLPILQPLSGFAQSARSDRSPSQPPAPDIETPPPGDIDYDSEPPYDLNERHWRRYGRDYSHSRWDRDQRGWYRSPYRPGWSTFGPYPYGDPGDPAFDEGYYEGIRDGRRQAEWEQRASLGREAYMSAMAEGLEAFRHGDYPSSVRHFVRAAKLNQGDPASRIHAAHAMTAVGSYAGALPALRRAFQLQSKIAYLALDIHRDYGRPADFDAHYSALKVATEDAKDDPALWLLLGYYQFYSGREADALVSLRRSNELAPKDFMTELLLEAAGLTAPKVPSPPREPGAPPLGGGGQNARPGQDA